MQEEKAVDPRKKRSPYNTGVCDWCEDRLIAPEGYVLARAYWTIHGLFCRSCIKNWPGRIKKLCIYLPGYDVTDEIWYMEIERRKEFYGIGL